MNLRDDLDIAAAQHEPGRQTLDLAQTTWDYKDPGGWGYKVLSYAEGGLINYLTTNGVIVTVRVNELAQYEPTTVIRRKEAELMRPASPTKDHEFGRPRPVTDLSKFQVPGFDAPKHLAALELDKGSISSEGARALERYVLKDSGDRKTFDGGAQRDASDTDKGQPFLTSPIALWRVGVVNAKGAEKYQPRNWEKGMPIANFLNSAMRHLYQWIAGDDSEDHLAQAAWNILGAIHVDELVRLGKMPKEFLTGKDDPDPSKRIASARMMHGPVDLLAMMKGETPST